MARKFSQCGVVSFIVMLVVGALSVLAPPVEAQIPKSGSAKVHSGWFSAGETKKVGEKRLYWIGVYWGVSFNDEGKGFRLSGILRGAKLLYYQLLMSTD